MSRSALVRHKADHIPEQLRKARDVAEVAEADSLLEEVQQLHREAKGVFASAKRDGDGRLALLAIAAAARYYARGSLS